MKKILSFLIIVVLIALCMNSQVYANNIINKGTGIYMWEVSNIDYDLYEKMVRDLKINKIYSGEVDGFSSEDYQKLIKFAKKENIDIYIVYGELNTNVDENLSWIKELIDRVEEYNKNADYKFAGVAIDSEFHSSDEYASASKAGKQKMLADYVLSMKNAYKYAQEKNLKFVSCIPTWYDTIDEKQVEELIKSGCDYVQIMNYSKKNAVNAISNEVEYAKKYGKPIESIAELQEIGLHGVTEDLTFNKDGLDACLNKFNEIDNNYNYDALTYCFHYYRGLAALYKEKINSEEKATPTPIAEEKDTPTPTSEEKVTPTPTSEEKVTPTPTSEEKVTPTPTSEEKVTPTPTAVEEKNTPAPIATNKGNDNTIANVRLPNTGENFNTFPIFFTIILLSLIVYWFVKKYVFSIEK